MAFEHVLVPLDGSGFAEHALPYAADVSRRSGAKLTLIAVASPAEVAPGAGQHASDESVHRWDERLKRHLTTLAARVRRETTVEPEVIVLDGEPTAVLDAYATQIGADLVVMTTHGTGPLSRMWLGSVADGILRRTDHTLLLIRPRVQAASLRSPSLPRRVIVPLDGSALAEEIIGPSLELAALWPMEFRLVRVVRPGVLDIQRDLDERQRRAAEYLREVWSAHYAAYPRRSWSTRAVIQRDVATWLLKYSRSSADMVAMTTRGHDGLDRLLLGSVADKLVRGATGPVLIQRPRSADTRQ